MKRWTQARIAAVVLVVGSSAIGCGGGTTGLEKLDGNVPPPPMNEAGVVIDAGSTLDVSSLDVKDATAEPTSDASIRPDTPTPDDEEDSGPRSDGQRMRDGVVVRDGIILDPTNDVATDSDAPREAGPTTVCGDGKKEGKEECDDSNTVNGDGCSGICTDQAVCDACIGANCAEALGDPPLWPLCGSLVGTAKNGEGAGRPRKDLCQEVYTCALRSNCMVWETADITPCYCGTALGEPCLQPGKANGPCKVEIENGVESVDPSIIANSLLSNVNASGAALLIRRCAHDLCPDECSPYIVRDGGTRDAPATQDTPNVEDATSQDSANPQDGAGPQDAPNAQ
ncbi:MAG: hypothetical protein ABW133_10670 [Polyangiaceae bacterium]